MKAAYIIFVSLMFIPNLAAADIEKHKLQLVGLYELEEENERCPALVTIKADSDCLYLDAFDADNRPSAEVAYCQLNEGVRRDRQLVGDLAKKWRIETIEDVISEEGLKHVYREVYRNLMGIAETSFKIEQTLVRDDQQFVMTYTAVRSQLYSYPIVESATCRFKVAE